MLINPDEVLESNEILLTTVSEDYGFFGVVICMPEHIPYLSIAYSFMEPRSVEGMPDYSEN